MKSLHGGSKRVLSIIVYAGTLLVLSLALGAVFDSLTAYSELVTNLAFVLVAVPAALILADRVHRLSIADSLAGGALAVFASHCASVLFAHMVATPVGGSVTLGDYYGTVSVSSIATQLLTVVIGSLFWRFALDRMSSRSKVISR